jgi:hypothetical protein
VTGYRGSRAAAGGGHKKECLAPCPAPAAAPPLLYVPGLAPGPVDGAAVPVRGMGVGAEGRWFLTAGRQWRRRRGGGMGLGRWQDIKGELSREGQEKMEVHLRLVPGGRIRGSEWSPPGWSAPSVTLSALSPEAKTRGLAMMLGAGRHNRQ